jgi:hypothetical protein
VAVVSLNTTAACRNFWQRDKVLCCHALEIFEALDSDHGRAHTENHLGVLHYRRREWEQAEQHLNRLLPSGKQCRVATD